MRFWIHRLSVKIYTIIHTHHTHTHIYACFALSSRATASVGKESLKSASLQKRSHGHHDSLRSLIVCAVPCSMFVCSIALSISFFKSHIRRAWTLIACDVYLVPETSVCIYTSLVAYLHKILLHKSSFYAFMEMQRDLSLKNAYTESPWHFKVWR